MPRMSPSDPRHRDGNRTNRPRSIASARRRCGPAVGDVSRATVHRLDQLHTLADAAGEHRPPVYVLGTCGLRFGEVAELRWRDVDLEGLRLRVARSVTLIDGQLVIGLPKSAHHASGPRPSRPPSYSRAPWTARSSMSSSLINFGTPRRHWPSRRPPT